MPTPDKDVVAMQNSRLIVEIVINSGIFRSTFSTFLHLSTSFPAVVQIMAKAEVIKNVQFMPSRQHFIHETIHKFLPRQAMRLLSLPRAPHFMFAEKKCGNRTHARAFRLSQWPIRKRKRPEIFSGCAKTLPTSFLCFYFNIRFLCFLNKYLAKPQLLVPFSPSYFINFHSHSQILYLPFLAGWKENLLRKHFAFHEKFIAEFHLSRLTNRMPERMAKRNRIMTIY